MPRARGESGATGDQVPAANGKQTNKRGKGRSSSVASGTSTAAGVNGPAGGGAGGALRAAQTASQRSADEVNATANAHNALAASSSSSAGAWGADGRSSSSSSASSAAAEAPDTSPASPEPADKPTLLVDEPKAKRWRDWWLRVAMTFVMIGSVVALMGYTKQLGVVTLIFVLQGSIYRELVKIAVVHSKEKSLPGFKLFYYYWFFVVAFFMYAKTLQPYLLSAILDQPVRVVRPVPPSTHGGATAASAALASSQAAAGQLNAGGPGAVGAAAAAEVASVIAQALPHLQRAALFVANQHVAISFSLWMLGFVWFVASLRKKNMRYQFSQFAYCHIALIVVVVQSTFLAANVFNGLLWFALPCGLVVINDSMAYVSGFFFGRTPLTKLSPKKTVEGFLGGAFFTVVLSFFLTGWLQNTEAGGVRYLMLCPVEHGLGLATNICDPAEVGGRIFLSYPVSTWWFSGLIPGFLQNYPVSEMQLHAMIMAVFASFIAPFGGFFASGFKRALKIKDFGDAIPGHGGFTDRMDCQLLMGSFSYVYATYLLKLGTGFRGGEAAVMRLLLEITTALRAEDVLMLQQRLNSFVEAQRFNGSAPALT